MNCQGAYSPSCTYTCTHLKAILEALLAAIVLQAGEGGTQAKQPGAGRSSRWAAGISGQPDLSNADLIQADMRGAAEKQGVSSFLRDRAGNNQQGGSQPATMAPEGSVTSPEPQGLRRSPGRAPALGLQTGDQVAIQSHDHDPPCNCWALIGLCEAFSSSKIDTLSCAGLLGTWLGTSMSGE